MNLIMVDDEPKAIDLLLQYVGRIPDIKCMATFRNGLKALAFLEKHAVDLILLDINMPHIDGLALAKSLDSGAKIIFTTAYEEYAVTSYELNAIDYLLKPIKFERFVAAIDKVRNSMEPISNSMVIKSGLDFHRLLISEILFLKKDGNYMIYKTSNKKIMARESISTALDKLPKQFIQIHKSYVINLHQVERFNREVVWIGKHEIPIGPSYKQLVMEAIKNT